MERASTARCPDCGTKVRLIADREGGFHAEHYEPPERP
jgi:hypothetical protein